jgi:hypothetical protein
MRAAAPEDAIAWKIISYLQEGAMRLDPCVLRRLADIHKGVLGSYDAASRNDRAAYALPRARLMPPP